MMLTSGMSKRLQERQKIQRHISLGKYDPTELKLERVSECII